MIEIRDLVVRKNGATICAIDQLSIGSGERVGIVGANGSGKTTLLRVLAGLEREFAGDCWVDAARRQRVYVHQSPYLFRGTVLYNVKYGLRARGEHGSVATDRAMSWLEHLGVASLADRSGANLSGGEKRRVALARALVLAPSLLLLDEPLAEMDDDGIAAVKTALGKLDDTTVLIASPTDLPADIVTTTHRPAINSLLLRR